MEAIEKDNLTTSCDMIEAIQWMNIELAHSLGIHAYSFATGRCSNMLKYSFYTHLQNTSSAARYENTLMCMPQNFASEKSAWVQVMVPSSNKPLSEPMCT